MQKDTSTQQGKNLSISEIASKLALLNIPPDLSTSIIHQLNILVRLKDDAHFLSKTLEAIIIDSNIKIGFKLDVTPELEEQNNKIISDEGMIFKCDIITNDKNEYNGFTFEIIKKENKLKLV